MRIFTLQELAAAVGYSRSHFLRAFHATTGVTPHRYLLNRRIERARRVGEVLAGTAPRPVGHLLPSAHECKLLHRRYASLPINQHRGHLIHSRRQIRQVNDCGAWGVFTV
jgi:hypothetical protein